MQAVMHQISLSQVSKAVAALEEELLIGSQGRCIYMLDPDEIRNGGQAHEQTDCI